MDRVVLLKLLQDGYFPRELPPPFTTSSFANFVDKNFASFVRIFKKFPKASTSGHNISRVGILRRKLDIPNPITQFLLCNEIAENWSSLDHHLNKSSISSTRPVFINGSTRALVPNCHMRMRPCLRAQFRAGAKYILEADIENFYHSIYTHSIAWALHTKPYIRENNNIHNMGLLGNRLDQLIGNCNDKQSVGIPIGPDTSLLFAEVLLSAVDKSIEDELGLLKGFRYIDDYELSFSNLADAEKALRILESKLSDFDLDLNPKKTKIEELPLPLEDWWATELKLFDFRPHSQQKRDLISFFSRAFELAKEYPNEYVLKYAIPKLRSVQIELDNWSLLQSLLLQCLNNEPGTIPYVLEQYVQYSNMGYPIENDQLEETLNSQIKYHAPLGHGSEVAWSLWGAIAFQIFLDSDSASAVSQMEDSIVALLALDAEQRKLFSSSIDTNFWERYMDRDDLYGDQWLLSYEANVKGWIPSAGSQDHVLRDAYFSHLKKYGVQFYDESQAARIIPSATLPLPGGYCI